MVVTQPPDEPAADRLIREIGAEIRQSVQDLQSAVQTLAGALQKADTILPHLHQHRRLYRLEVVLYGACALGIIAAAIAAVVFTAKGLR